MRIFNKKHVFVLILVMLCIFTVTSVSASDLNATDVGLFEDMSDNILNDETTKLTSVEESDEVLVLDNQSNTLSATYYPTSVSQLKSDISSANAGDTIVLSGTYKIHDYTISKELTFIGTNGATFDGEDNRIFGIENSIVTFKNITFKNGYGRYGGTLDAYSGQVIFDNCKFLKSYAAYRGGTLFIGGTAYCKITNSYFTNSKVGDGSGGAICIENSGEIINCTIEGCSVTDNGGAVVSRGANNLKIIDSTFINCRANYGGAIRILDNSRGLLIDNCTFKNNVASQDGGAISRYESSSVDIINSNFEGNSAQWGGAIYLKYTDGKLSNCTFKNNHASVDSGAVSGGVLTDCTFIGNTAVDFGGAAAWGSYINCNFINNSANNYGGAINNGNSIENCIFINNSANNYGGAIRSNDRDYLKIKDCYFEKCQVYKFGGAIDIYKVKEVNIIDCDFYECFTDINDGGAISSDSCTNVNILGCDFDSCKSNGFGGSVRVVNTGNLLTISDCNFSDSYSNTEGGSVYSRNVPKVIIDNCDFSNSSSNLAGCSIDIVSTTNTVIKNSNFTNSSHNGNDAITFSGSSKYEILDSIFDVAPKNVIYHYDTILSADDLSIVNGEQCTIRATLSNVVGPLSNKQVTFSVNGNSYSRTTSSDGVVSFPANDYISGLGNHEVIVSYEGDSLNSAVSQKINVKVNMYRATLTVTPYGKYYGDKSLSFKVVDSDNNVKSDVPIHVDIYLNGNLYKSADISTGSNGMVTYSMSSFEPGNYSVKAYVTTQNVDVNSVEEDNIVISKISGVIELSTSNNNKTLNVKLVNPANGDVYGDIQVKLQFNPNGYETAVTTDSSGCVSVPLMFDLGTYSVVASVDSSGFKEFPIAELQNIVISTAGKDDSVVKFNNAIVFDYLKSGSTTLTLEGCTVTREKVSVDNHPEASIVVSGNKITVSGLAAGSYTLRVVSTPDQYHNSVTRTVGITVNKVDSSITIAKPVSFSYGDSGSTNVNVNGGSIVYGGVSVDGHPEAFIGVVNNEITVSNLPVGSYTLRITSAPDSNHNAVTKTTTITVNKVDSKISFDKAISFVYGKSSSAALTLTGCDIVREGISVDGHPEAVISVNNNVVSVSNLSVGGYTLRITSVPDSNHNAVTNTIVVTVSKADSDVKFSKAISYDYGGSGSTTLTLTGCSVTLGNIKVDNHPEAVIRINGNVVSVSNLAVGSYTLRVTSTPDSNHNAVTRTVGITVNKASAKVGFSNPIVFDYLGDGSTTLILDGCTVSLSNLKVVGHPEALVSINSNNVVSVSGLNAGNYTLSVEAIPDANHRSAVATLPITVNKIDSDIIFIEDYISFKYSESGSTAIVLDNCNVASMSILGESVNPVCNGNVISVSGLPVGEYVLKVITQPVNNNYNSVERVIPVIVAKNTATINIKKSQTVAYKKSTLWSITLKGSDGKAISGIKPVLKIYKGNKLYKTVNNLKATNSAGVTNYQTSGLPVGTYKFVVSVSHAGYSVKSVSTPVKVIKQTPIKIIVKTKTAKKGGTINVIVKDKSGKKYLNGIKVTIKIKDGKNYKTVTLTTGKFAKASGVCAYSTNMLAVGKHAVTVKPASVKYSGTGKATLKIQSSAKKYRDWWVKVNNGIESSHGLK